MLPFLHSLIKESECWRFTLPPSPLKVSLSQCSPYSLLPTLYPLLTHIWQRSGCVKVVWLPPPSYPHFFSRWVPSCSCLFSFSSPPCHPTHSFSLLDPPGKKKQPHCKLMLDCAAILFQSLLFCLGRPSRLVGRVCDFDAHTPGGEVKMLVGILEPANSKDFSRRFF